MRNKNGEMTMPILITAIIALIVLIVMIAIFTGKIGWFNQNSATCSARGGQCMSDAGGQCSEGKTILFTEDCQYIEAGKQTQTKRLGQCCVSFG
jgi:hypothetical protein